MLDELQRHTRSAMDHLDLLIDLHRANPRQGPGGDLQTEQALGLTGLDAQAPLSVADIGCGTGASTLALARLLPRAQITAVDFLAPFLSKLRQRLTDADLGSRVTPLEASMDALPFDDAQFDLLWSEGAVYNMGFESGVSSWRRILKPGGVLAVSELTWTTGHRPPELQAHWEREYPEVGTAAAKIGVLERLGYSPMGYFVLPASCWLDNYYRPLQAGFGDFLTLHAHSEAARAVVTEHEQEIALYEKHKAHFGYGFYVAKKAP